MAEIKVTSATLRSKAAELKQLNGQFKSAVGALESEEANLNSQWEGEAHDAFHNAFSKDKVQMDNFYNAIENYCTSLLSIAEQYEKAENANVATATTRSY